jgi:site-specific DNA-adenine methylase
LTSLSVNPHLYKKGSYKMAKYGMPYRGSKSSICDELLQQIPKAGHFYDLFGGGGAVFHAASLSGRWERVHYNEIDSRVVALLRDAIEGRYSYDNFKPPWVSREEFFAKKDSDAYIRLCWSFGNNQKDYLYGKDIEVYKKSMHQAVIFNEFDDLAEQVFGFSEWKDVQNIKERRLFLRKRIPEIISNRVPEFLAPFIKVSTDLTDPGRLQQLEQLQQLQQLERFQQLEQLQRTVFTLSSQDYREVEIPPDSVVYCDIPYKNTAGYPTLFDRHAFLDWAAKVPFSVYISEYGINDSRFLEVWQKTKRKLAAGSKSKGFDAVEKLYWNGKKV